jgi:hypothetical protein
MGGVVVGRVLPDGQLLALSAGDGAVDLWEVTTGKRQQTLLGRRAGLRVAFARRQDIASIGHDYRIQRAVDQRQGARSHRPADNLLVAPLARLAFADNERVIAWMTAAQFTVA